jgi:hypothetical protein
MFIRITEPGRPGFQLRKGEEGLSVFDAEAVEPQLTEGEILAAFRVESQLISRTREEIEAKGLIVVPVPGSATLPLRLRNAHAEIRKGPGISRGQFKQALQELE